MREEFPIPKFNLKRVYGAKRTTRGTQTDWSRIDALKRSSVKSSVSGNLDDHIMINIQSRRSELEDIFSVNAL